ncbi:Sterol 3-beta-glucosyltransferase UGT80B1 [Citrus sinensis]|nr:Sterol 3-beta-glucosyltransferase UGT80B1 [Citrus sinensis]
MRSNGFDHPLKDVDKEEGVGGSKTLNKDLWQTDGIDEPMNMEYMSSEKEYNARAFQSVEKQKTNSLEQSPVVGISLSKKEDVHSSPRASLDHCITAPITRRDSLTDMNEFRYSRSMTEKKSMPRHDLKLDRLSDREKKKLIVELVRIQNDGTVEVDLDKSAPVASEFLEFQPVEGPPIILDDTSFSDSKKSIPRLNIAILVVGTRGDEFGHRVRLATHANFRTFVRSAGVDFFPLGGDPRVLAGYMARNKGLIPSGPGEISIQRKQIKAIIESLLPACTDPDIETGVPFRSQAIIANPPAYGHAHVAEALGVPIHIFFTMPWTAILNCKMGRYRTRASMNRNTHEISHGQLHVIVKTWLISSKTLFETSYLLLFSIDRPTYEFPHPLARVPQSAGYWLSYIIVDLLIWWGIRSYINDFRKRKLKLPPIAYFSTYHGSISHLPTAYMWSPHLVPKPSDWGSLVAVVGYCLLNLGSKYQPQENFVQWIQRGPEPIYIGFGSMPLEDPKKTTEIILEALRDTGQRGIIDRVTEVPDNIFLLEDCPHDWLFPQCSAVVHHGGAGTTATGLKAGCPTTIVPFFGDQFFWGDRVQQKGLGPAPIPISQLTVENLSNAVRFMLQPEVKSRAMELAKLIENEDGVAAAVDAFHRHLPDEIPMPSALPEKDDGPDPLQWFFIQIGNWCCQRCGGV